MEKGERPTFLVRPVSGDRDWEAARAIRTDVFVREQSCPPEEEWDDHDASARHLLGFLDQKPIAVARWRVVPLDTVLVAKLERFAVLAPYRGRGFGKEMVRAAISDAQRAGFDRQYIHAQAHLREYYERLGFDRFGEAFVEAGIAHVRMIRIAP